MNGGMENLEFLHLDKKPSKPHFSHILRTTLLPHLMSRLWASICRQLSMDVALLPTKTDTHTDMVCVYSTVIKTHSIFFFKKALDSVSMKTVILQSAKTVQT